MRYLPRHAATVEHDEWDGLNPVEHLEEQLTARYAEQDAKERTRAATRRTNRKDMRIPEQRRVHQATKPLFAWHPCFGDCCSWPAPEVAR